MKKRQVMTLLLAATLFVGTAFVQPGCSGEEASQDTTWSSQMQKAFPRVLVAKAASEEQVAAFVERMYTEALGRASEEKGKKDWTSQLTGHTSDGAKLAEGFIRSDEFKNRNLSNEDYLTVLYKTFFDREPDEGGYQGWLKQLNSGVARETVLSGFVDSLEFANLCVRFGISQGYMFDTGAVANPGIGLFVYRLYETLLGRQPDGAGLNDWTQKIATNQIAATTVATDMFIQSSEFQTKQKDMTNEQYADVMYATFFGRDADEAGKSYWMKQLSAGAKREEIVYGFAGAQEFSNLQTSFGIQVGETKPYEEKDTTGVPETEGEYRVLKDENGNVYDLGGMEIIIRDWWSGIPDAPANEYEEARQEYREWIQDTYNFTIKQTAISDWGSTPEDFVNYVTAGGDEKNYVFILRDDPLTSEAMKAGLMYDLSTLDCLDFSKAKFQKNLLHKLYSKGDAIYAMHAGVSEPRGGMYFNKRILTEAGIDPESIYDLQASGNWTWDKWVELMKKVQRDTDNDGVIDIWGTTQNNSSLINYSVWSNGGEYVGQENGQYVYKLENPETVEALEFAVKMFDNYTLPYPEGAVWDYYMDAFVNGEAAFMPEDGYAGTPENFLEEMEDDFGWVAFPKGPKATDYTNCWSNNPSAIPACYDADRAWKIAFAWNLYTDEAPGWENYDLWKENYYAGFRDKRAVDETAKMLTEKGMITYHGMIPNLNLGPDLTWGIRSGTNVSEEIAEIRDTWKKYIADANK